MKAPDRVLRLRMEKAKELLETAQSDGERQMYIRIIKWVHKTLTKRKMARMTLPEEELI